MSPTSSLPPMPYRRMGRSGLRLSALSLGSWLTFHDQVDGAGVREMMALAFDHGVNFFDNAEAYAHGQSEVVMGRALRELGWNRLHYVVSSKFYWGLESGGPPVNGSNTLNRKYLLQAVDGSLRRLGLDFLDLVYCHRPDPNTPVEETVWAMHDLIARGRALYWGTSEWSAAEIRHAWELAERHHLHKPVVEQPQYNLFHRRRVEVEYRRLIDELGLGLTVWSPLASGLLTGKYRQGIPAGSRGSLPQAEFLREALLDQRRNRAVDELGDLAAELGCSSAQLAIAWAAARGGVSSVILGASSVQQLRHNLGALQVLQRLDAAMLARIESLTEPASDLAP